VFINISANIHMIASTSILTEEYVDVRIPAAVPTAQLAIAYVICAKSLLPKLSIYMKQSLHEQ